MKTGKLICAVLFSCLISKVVSAQTNTFPATGSAGIGTTTPAASSVLEMISTDKGLLIPRMTQAQRSAIVSPAAGLLVYQTNGSVGFHFYDGSTWKQVGAGLGASKTLNNLTSPTAINTDMLPGTNGNLSLGNNIIQWKNIYLDGGLFDSSNRLFFANINNTAAGYNALLNNATGTQNTAGGSGALQNNISGFGNTANGSFSLQFNTSGSFNTANGTIALGNNTTGYYNTASGYAALYKNTYGFSNTATGTSSLGNNTVGNRNVASGYYALHNNTAGSDNVANGTEAMFSNTDGYGNTVNGFQALYSNTTGIYNTANGLQTLYKNTSGTYNTANGYQALYNNTLGNYNNATGYQALGANTTGNENIAIGKSALKSNTTGSNNIAMGTGALFTSTTQRELVAIGDSALYNNGDGATQSYHSGNNTAIGYKALYANRAGHTNTAIGWSSLLSNTLGSENSAIGSLALGNNTTGSYNTGHGYYSLIGNISGHFNVSSGAFALQSNTTGSGNTAVGYRAAFFHSSGNYITAIGSYTDVNNFNFSNTTMLGYSTMATASDQVRIGNSSVTSIGGYTGWSNISDSRVKKNIKENVPGLAFINKLKPVTYNLNLDAADNIIQAPAQEDKNGKKRQPFAEELQARKQKEQIVYTGFVAQQVEQAAKSIGYDFSGVDAAKNDNDLYGLRYAEFVVPLVKAVQELSIDNEQLKMDNEQLKMDNDDMKSGIGNLESENKELKSRLDKIEALLFATPQAGADNNQSLTLSAPAGNAEPVLEQNRPNPFNGITTIRCFLPVNNGNCYIHFYSNTGTLLKTVKITGTGWNVITITAGELAAGAYKYALMIDGKSTASKTMLLQH